MLLIEVFKKELQQYENYNSYIGKQVVIDGDTTRIVKYDSGGYGIPGGFYLYNGAIVSPNVVEKFIIE